MSDFWLNHSLNFYQTLNGALQQCVVGARLRPSEAQRLWDTSARSATAALILAETLDDVLLIHARLTLPLTWSAISRTTDMFLPGQKRSLLYFCTGENGWGVRGTAPLSWKRDSYFDTHTVDFKQPWTNGNSGFFSHYVFYFFKVCKENTNCNFRKQEMVFRTIIFWGFVFRMPTCLDVSQDN